MSSEVKFILLVALMDFNLYIWKHNHIKITLVPMIVNGIYMDILQMTVWLKAFSIRIGHRI